MDKNGLLQIAIVGAAGQRAAALKIGIESTGKAKVNAICDVNPEKLDRAATFWGAEEKYTDFQQMVEKASIDVVMLETPPDLHVSQSLQALEKGKHVYSDIPAGINLSDCKQLVKSCKKSQATYVMGENVCYMKEYMTVEEFVNRGLFGEVYYAEGEYLHELKTLFETSRWRKDLLVGVNGITYGTHNVGPILAWMKGDRINKVSCIGTGHHYKDKTNKSYSQEDGCLMLGKTEHGKLVEIHVDMLSTRPYGLNFRLQGTKGAFESVHDWKDGRTRLWAEALDTSGEKDRWIEFNKVEADYLPDIWRNVPENVVKETAHWGIDYVTIREYIGFLFGLNKFKVGIHEAMDMTLPCIVSQLSIESDGKWMDVPNSRDW